MTSRSMMRSVSAPAADITPPPIVSLALRSTPFKSATTRRDLSTSFRGFKTAWTAIEQVQVLSASCRRLAERAAEVLFAVREKLEEIEREEGNQKGGKVVLERAYEFQGSKAGGEMAGKTIFKIQSTILDLQAFATDHLAKSDASRLALLVDDLSKTKIALAKLSESLLTCISTYSLSPVISTSLWPEQDAADLIKDHAALPRLFQLSIMLKGPVYDRFTKERTPIPPSNETPGQRRAAFIEWCLEQNPILRPGGGVPVIHSSTISVAAPVLSNGIGLGLPSGLTSGVGGVSMRRAATQPLSFSKPSILASIPAPAAGSVPTLQLPSSLPQIDSPPTEAVSSGDPIPSSLSSAPIDSILSATSSTVTDPTPTNKEQESIRTLDPITPGIPSDSPVGKESTEIDALAHSSTKVENIDHLPTSHALDRSTSTVSSMAMTTSSSAGSLLFEPVLPAIAVEEVQSDGEVESLVEEEDTVEEKSGEKESAEEEATIESALEGERGIEGNQKMSDLEANEEEGGSQLPVKDELVAVELGEENSTLADLPSTRLDLNGSLLGLALDTPLPLSPPVDGISHLHVQDTSSPTRQGFTPAPLELLEPLPIAELETLPLLEPRQLPPSPALPSSPSLIVTSFDEAESIAESPPSHPPKPNRSFRILSLDGGGLVGPIPQLLALKRHFNRNEETTLPSRHFDLIVGTSSSALPALLLGQLGLSIDETLRICAQVSQKALGLEGPASSSKSAKPRRVGRWSRFFSRGNRSASTTTSSLDRRAALDAALKQFIQSATAPLPLSRTSSRAAVLAFTRTQGRAQECWLSGASNLSLSEIVQASMAFPSPASPYVPSPTSSNPSSSALKYSESLLATKDQHVDILSLSIGYSVSSIPVNDSKRISRNRLESLRNIKQVGAGNSAEADAFSHKISRDTTRVNLTRIDSTVNAGELSSKDEGELMDNWNARAQMKGTPRTSPATTAPLSPRNNSSSSPFLLSPPGSPSSLRSQPPPLSPSSTKSHSPRKRSSPLNLFSSARRSASSSEITHSNVLSSPPGSPFLSNKQRNMSLAFDEYDEEGEEEVLGFEESSRGIVERKGLRSSISMGELQRDHGRGMYSMRAAEGSLVDIRM